MLTVFNTGLLQLSALTSVNALTLSDTLSAVLPYKPLELQ